MFYTWQKRNMSEGCLARNKDAGDDVDDGAGVEETGDDAEPGGDHSEAPDLVEVVESEAGEHEDWGQQHDDDAAKTQEDIVTSIIETVSG